MQIRQYVLSLIFRGDNSVNMLPSLAELMEKFHTSRPTVCKAIKALTEEGLVIGKQGIGTFINHHPAGMMISLMEYRPIVVGIIFGDGRHIGLDGFFGRILAGVLNHASDYLFWIRPVYLSSYHAEDIAREIEYHQLDALIHLGPPEGEALKASIILARKKALKIVVGDVDIPEISSVHMNFYGLGRRYGQELIARGVDNLLFYPLLPPWNIELNGILDEYAANNRPINTSFPMPKVDEETLPSEKIANCCRAYPEINAIYPKLQILRVLDKRLQEIAPDILERCCFLANAFDAKYEGRTMHVLGAYHPYELYGIELLKEIHAQLNGKTEITHKVLPTSSFKIEFFG